MMKLLCVLLALPQASLAFSPPLMATTVSNKPAGGIVTDVVDWVAEHFNDMQSPSQSKNADWFATASVDFPPPAVAAAKDQPGSSGDWFLQAIQSGEVAKPLPNVQQGVDARSDADWFAATAAPVAPPGAMAGLVGAKEWFTNAVPASTLKSSPTEFGTKSDHHWFATVVSTIGNKIVNHDDWLDDAVPVPPPPTVGKAHQKHAEWFTDAVPSTAASVSVATTRSDVTGGSHEWFSDAMNP